MRRAFTTTLLLLTLGGHALADGKAYWPEKIPPRIPYQRAIILSHEGMETLILQSRFDLRANSASNTTFGWVVPVPAVPDVASTNSWASKWFFDRFDRASGPVVITCLELLAFSALGLGAVSLIILGLGLLSLVIPPLRFVRAKGGIALRLAMLGLIVAFLAVAIIPAFMSAASPGGGVEVLKTQAAGIYEAKVIKARTSADLVAWLKENGFRFGTSDIPVLDRYVQDGWCFVVAKGATDESFVQDVVRGGQHIVISNRVSTASLNEADERKGFLIDPLVLTFRTRQPIYPLALTSTIGSDTEVLIYLLADQKMSCNGRLKVRTAADFRFSRLGDTLFAKECFSNSEPQQRVFLTKFKGKLTPEQMRQDLVFVPADDSKPYREHVLMW